VPKGPIIVLHSGSMVFLGPLGNSGGETTVN